MITSAETVLRFLVTSEAHDAPCSVSAAAAPSRVQLYESLPAVAVSGDEAQRSALLATAVLGGSARRRIRRPGLLWADDAVCG